MIGPEHLPDSTAARPRRIAVITGTRAEFGLLRPVMRAIAAHGRLELLCIAAGSHLISPADTFREVKAAFPIADSIPMQIAGQTGRAADVQALSRGVGRLGRCFEGLRPDWVVVLGDRIEAFAAASAAAVGGFALAHIHGGDRAEGIADESMRHAITKLANLHFAATNQSADRIVRMGEPARSVHVVGSPALDELPQMPPLDESVYAELGAPLAVILFHPVGRHAEQEEAAAATLIRAARDAADGRVLLLHPNFDPGRDGIVRAIAQSGLRSLSHVPREEFVGLLKRLAAGGGVLVGNSSAALIEAAALKLPAVDVGPRQNGRERCGNVVHSDEGAGNIAAALARARAIDRGAITHDYGHGDAGRRIAAMLSAVEPPARKHNEY